MKKLLSILTIAVACSLPGAAMATTQGCTPGFWKNHQSAWYNQSLQPILTSKLFSTICKPSAPSVPDGVVSGDIDPPGLPSGDITLIEALNSHCGANKDGTKDGQNECTFLRHVTAAWLNASHPALLYALPSTVEDLCAQYVANDQYAFAYTGTDWNGTNLAEQNEDLPCTINGKEVFPQ